MQTQVVSVNNMPLKQTINYNSSNKYFAGFLQDIMNTTKIDASVEFKDQKITLTIDDTDKQKLELFNDKINRYLPNSIFLSDIDTRVDDTKVILSNFRSPNYNIAPCLKCLELLTDPSSKFYLDGSLKCNHYSNDASETFEDTTIFTPHYIQGFSLLVCDTSKLSDLFIMTQDEIDTLLSIEKPTLKVTIKDEELKKLTNKNYIYIKAPYNNRSTLASLNAKESGIEYLFFEDQNDLKMVVVQKNKTIIKASRVAKQLENLNDDQNINRFLNIKKEAAFDKSSIGAVLSTDGINFIVSNENGTKKVLTFQEFCFEDFIKKVKQNSIRSKLLENFIKAYPNFEQKISSSEQIGLYELIVYILDIEIEDINEDLAFETLCNKSYEFRGNGGLKIDMFFSDTKGNDVFDYISFLCSIMSFKLANSENHYIAYSIFEAYGDMAISVINQLKEQFNIKDFIMLGNMFENSVMYSRILSKFQLSNPYFSKTIALDD